MPVEDGWKNLIPMSQRSEEEKKAIHSKAMEGVKRYHERMRTAKEVAKAILAMQMADNDKRQILGDAEKYLPNGATMLEVLTMRQALEAQEGNTKAYEVLRDTAGYKPVDQVQADVNVLSDQDRSLLDKVARRTGIDPEEH